MLSTGYLPNDKIYPVILIEEYIERVRTAYAQQEMNQPIEPKKEAAFEEASTGILTAALRRYHILRNNITITKDFQENKIGGTSQPMDKSAFAADQGIHHVNFNTALADGLSRYIREEVSLSIDARVSTRYVVNKSQFSDALKRLRIVPGKHVVLSFGIEKATLIDSLKAANTELPEQDVIFMPLETYTTNFFQYDVLVLQKNKLPNIEHHSVPDQMVDMLRLKTYDEAFHIYGSVIDLHTDRTVKDRLGSFANINLEKSVLVTLQHCLVLRWSNSTAITQLSIYDPYIQRGNPNNSSDIKPIE